MDLVKAFYQKFFIFTCHNRKSTDITTIKKFQTLFILLITPVFFLPGHIKVNLLGGEKEKKQGTFQNMTLCFSPFHNMVSQKT